MSTDNIVSLLIAERDKVNRAIEALQGATKRRGLPPKYVASTVEPQSAEPKKKRHVSAAARRKMAAAQKLRWASVKAAK